MLFLKLRSILIVWQRKIIALQKSGIILLNLLVSSGSKQCMRLLKLAAMVGGDKRFTYFQTTTKLAFIFHFPGFVLD